MTVVIQSRHFAMPTQRHIKLEALGKWISCSIRNIRHVLRAYGSGSVLFVIQLARSLGRMHRCGMLSIIAIYSTRRIQGLSKATEVDPMEDYGSSAPGKAVHLEAKPEADHFPFCHQLSLRRWPHSFIVVHCSLDDYF